MPYTIPSSVISPGAVYQPRKSKLILDQIPGAIAAWSTRRLISSAPADIARGRDASTTEQDFTAAELAGTGFTDLAGAGDGFYVTLYDQIGSNNATQATAASQPKGVDTGTLITDGSGVPALDFDGTDDSLQSISPVIQQTGDFTLFFKYKYKTQVGGSLRVFFSQGSQATSFFGVGVLSSTEILHFYCDGTSATPILHGPLLNNTEYYILVVRSGDTFSLFIDEILIGSRTVASKLIPIDTNFILMDASYTINRQPNGQFTDLIVFNRALTAGEISQLHTALI